MGTRGENTNRTDARKQKVAPSTPRRVKRKSETPRNVTAQHPEFSLELFLKCAIDEYKGRDDISSKREFYQTLQHGDLSLTTAGRDFCKEASKKFPKFGNKTRSLRKRSKAKIRPTGPMYEFLAQKYDEYLRTKWTQGAKVKGKGSWENQTGTIISVKDGRVRVKFGKVFKKIANLTPEKLQLVYSRRRRLQYRPIHKLLEECRAAGYEG